MRNKKNDAVIRRHRTRIRRESGVTLIETLIAIVLLLVGVVALMGVFSIGISQTKQQGDNGTKTTEYCLDKVEQLMALSFNDGATDTTVYPAAPTGGTGLGGLMGGNQTVGSNNTSAPVDKYVDYFDGNGTLLTSSTGAIYTRAWSITSNATGTLKTITVTTTSADPSILSATVVCAKSSM